MRQDSEDSVGGCVCVCVCDGGGSHQLELHVNVLWSSARCIVYPPAHMGPHTHRKHYTVIGMNFMLLRCSILDSIISFFIGTLRSDTIAIVCVCVVSYSHPNPCVSSPTAILTRVCVCVCVSG